MPTTSKVVEAVYFATVAGFISPIYVYAHLKKIENKYIQSLSFEIINQQYM